MRSIYYWLLSILFWAFGFSVSDVVKAEKFVVAIDSLCRIEDFGDMSRFWDYTSHKREGKYNHVNVVHLGDSHVQAGYFSIPIRLSLTHLLGDGGIGCVAPYSLLRVNQPRHTKVTSSQKRWRGRLITSKYYPSHLINPTGLFLFAPKNKKAEIIIAPLDDHTLTNRVRVLRSSSSSRISSPLMVASNPKAPSLSSFRIGIVVDTLYFPTPQREVLLSLPLRSEFYGAVLEREESGAVLHTIGHNGAFFSTYNDSFLQGLRLLDPRLIIISLGTNEVLLKRVSINNSKGALIDLIRQIREELPQCSILITTPLYAYNKVRKRRRKYTYTKNPYCLQLAQELKSVAIQEKCAYLDLFSIFGGEEGASSLLEKGLLSKDHIHMTAQGYQEMGRVVALALERNHEQYQTSK